MSAPRRRAMTPLAWIGVALSMLAIVIGGIVWLGAMNDPDGDPLLENPSGVLIALIGALGLVASVVLPQLMQIKRHVENDHRDKNGKPIGLRDDLDAKFERVFTAIERVDTRVIAVTGRLDLTTARLDRTIDRLDDIDERTQPTRRKPS